MKKIIKGILQSNPAIWQLYSGVKFWFKHVFLLRYFLYDLKNAYRYMYWAPKKTSRSFDVLKSDLLFQFHKLEKGLIMPGERRVFGESVVVNILEIVQFWNKKGYSPSDDVYVAAIKTLESYLTKIDEDGFEHQCSVFQKVKRFLNEEKLLKHEEYSKFDTPRLLVNNYTNGLDGFKTLVSFRRSVREFSSKEVDKKLIANAVKIAQQSPSVCNRQSSKIYIFDDTSMIKKLLSFQNGNTGFENYIYNLAIITSDQTSFFNATERNQPFVDGGLFTMSYLYALSAQGLASCCLNWCVSPNTDKKVHELAKIANSERIVMYVAFGWPADNVSVPKSARKSLDDVLVYCK